MKNLVVVGTYLALSFFGLEGGAHPNHHVKHNMVLLGTTEVFASHIVFKRPHNYQVILKINFDEAAQTAYLREREAHPQDQMIFLLDEMDIKDIQSHNAIVGTLIRVDSKRQRIPILESIILKGRNFSVLFFNELPLSLE